MLSNNKLIKISIYDFTSILRLYEDKKALDGGIDGIDIITDILISSKYLIKKGGNIFLEIAEYHEEILSELIKSKQ